MICDARTDRIFRLVLAATAVALLAGHSPAAAQSATAAAGAPTAAAPAGDRAALCDHYVAVLSGKKKDAALLDDRDFQGFAQRVPKLATCGAIATENSDLCKPVSRWVPCPGCPPIGVGGAKDRKKSKTRDCYKIWSIFHELRADPKSRTFMLTECYDPGKEDKLCGPLLRALRSGDVAQCATAGEAQSLCRALITLDASQCQPIEGLEDITTVCKERIQGRGFLAKGLQPLAAAPPPASPGLAYDFGDPVDVQTYARAALGEADACAALAAAAREVCLKQDYTVPVPPTAPPWTPPAGTPGAGAPEAATPGAKATQP